MEYKSGSVGRVFLARFDHQDDFLADLRELIVKENIRQAWLHLLGGTRRAGVVTGPKEPVMPPDPVWSRIDEARETIGTGSVFWDDVEPKIHLHAAMGHHGDTMTACVRRETETYLILEALIIEINGIAASRPWFPAGGFNRLSFG